ncbi:MAG: helix-turn-helix domain-containing protein [Eubacterium sp.]|nr:helix-turn-helix domain-containing protein [Eubacterium sp.]
MDNRKTIQSILDYIENNLKAEININELCSMAGYSYVHFCRLFSHYAGLSPSEYITRRRLIHAVYDISRGTTKVDIALSYGFETYAGFYKAFKREFNCSPSEFIQSYKGEKPYRINILQEEHIMISKNRIQKLLSHWNLQNKSVSNIYNENTGRKSENTYYIGEEYVIKFSANYGSIKNSISIANSLAESGLPVAEMIKTADGSEYLQDGELYFVVTKRIKGSQLKCEDIFKHTTIAYQIGSNIAQLHHALKAFDESNYKQADILGDVKSALPKVQNSVNLNDDFIKNFSIIFDKLPIQIIHRDINPSNMIFDEGEFKGFIDFDLTEVNIRIFDICYCATAILSECFNNADIDKSKWLEIFDNLVKGYESIIPLSEYEKQALPYVIYSIQIICIAYFSQFDKFDSLTKINIDMLKWIVNELKV